MSADAGRRLRAFIVTRQSADEPWEAFAGRLGVTKSAVMSWLSGKTEPSLGSITAMARELGVRRWEVLAALDGNGPEGVR